MQNQLKNQKQLGLFGWKEKKNVLDVKRRTDSSYRKYRERRKSGIYKVMNFVDTYNTSSPDIQKKLMENKMVKVASKFHTKEVREQIIEERQIISDLKEKELEKHTVVRTKQEADVELFGNKSCDTNSKNHNLPKVYSGQPV